MASESLGASRSASMPAVRTAARRNAPAVTGSAIGAIQLRHCFGPVCRGPQPPDNFRRKGGRICKKCELHRANLWRRKKLATDPEYKERLRRQARERWRVVGKYRDKKEKRREIALRSYYRRAKEVPGFYAKRAAQKRKLYHTSEAHRLKKLAYAKRYRELHREELLAYKRALYVCGGKTIRSKTGLCERKTSDPSKRCAYHRARKMEEAA